MKVVRELCFGSSHYTDAFEEWGADLPLATSIILVHLRHFKQVKVELSATTSSVFKLCHHWTTAAFQCDKDVKKALATSPSSSSSINSSSSSGSTSPTFAPPLLTTQRSKAQRLVDASDHSTAVMATALRTMGLGFSRPEIIRQCQYTESTAAAAAGSISNSNSRSSNQKSLPPPPMMMNARNNNIPPLLMRPAHASFATAVANRTHTAALQYDASTICDPSTDAQMMDALHHHRRFRYVHDVAQHAFTQFDVEYKKDSTIKQLQVAPTCVVIDIHISLLYIFPPVPPL